MTRHTTDLADTLDHAWDHYQPGNDPLIDRLMALGHQDIAGDQRVRDRFMQLTAQTSAEASRPLAARHRTASPSGYTLGPRRMTRPTMGSVLLVTATMLVIALLTIGAYWLRTSPDSRGIRQELAALVGQDDSRREGTVGVSVLLQPGNDPSGQIEVTAWLVTLAPGAELIMPTAYDHLGTYPVSATLYSGKVTMLFPNGEVTRDGSGARASSDFTGSPLGYRNASTDPVELLYLGPTGALDLATLESAFQLFQITVTTDQGYQVAVEVQEVDERMLPQLASGPDREGSRWHIPYVELYVDEGSVLPTSGTPVAAGSTANINTATPGSVTLPTHQSGMFHGFALAVGPRADNPTLDQTVASIAPMWLNTSLPLEGPVEIRTRLLTLAPGHTYALPSDAVIAYGVISGSAVLGSSEYDHGLQILPGSVVIQKPGTTLTFVTMESDEWIVMLQVFVGDQSNVGDAVATPLTPGASTEHEQTIKTTLEVPSINVTLRIGEGGTGGQGGDAYTIIAPLETDITVARMGGEAYINRSDGSTAGDLTLGDPTPLKFGEVFVGEPGSGYQLGGLSINEQVATVFVGPAWETTPGVMATPSATVATPATPGASTSILANQDASCDVKPMTVAEFDSLIATPNSAPGYAERSARDTTGTPADDDTKAEVIAMLTGFTNCVAVGSDAQSLTFFTDQSLKEQPDVRERIEDDTSAGMRAPSQAVIEDIVIFSDGRVGVRFVLDNESAYLTLVKQDGDWKIDVWDDRATSPYPDSTPTP